MQSLLIIDDEPNVCYTLEKVLASAAATSLGSPDGTGSVAANSFRANVRPLLS